MSWYFSLSWLELTLCMLFLLLYAGYIYRIKKLALYFKQKANDIWFKFFIRSVYFFLLVVALLGPSFGATKKEIKTTGKDIFFLIDLTTSMNTQDVAPSRLEKIKFEITRALPHLNADRLGLIVFSSEAFVHCPLTFDENALQLYCHLIQTNQVPESSANFKAPLELALEKFNLTQEAPQVNDKTRIIVLFSDGETFGSEVRRVLKQLQKNNIRVFTVGTGSEEGGLVPIGKNFKRNKNGEQVTSRLQPTVLREIASRTGGQYFALNNQVNEMPLLEKTINQVAAEQQEIQTIDIAANKYRYPLFLALMLIVLDVMLTVSVIKI